MKYESQTFNRTAASLGATLLVLSAIGLVVPAIFHHLAGAGAVVLERELSFEIALVLMATYLLSLVFTLRTHRHLYVGDAGPHGLHEIDAELGSTKQALLLLLASTVGVALMSELLVGAVEEAAEAFGMSRSSWA